jgi:hypothetical protein
MKSNRRSFDSLRSASVAQDDSVVGERAWMDEALGETPYSTGKLRKFFRAGKAWPVAE